MGAEEELQRLLDPRRGSGYQTTLWRGHDARPYQAVTLPSLVISFLNLYSPTSLFRLKNVREQTPLQFPTLYCSIIDCAILTLFDIGQNKAWLGAFFPLLERFSRARDGKVRPGFNFAAQALGAESENHGARVTNINETLFMFITLCPFGSKSTTCGHAGRLEKEEKEKD